MIAISTQDGRWIKTVSETEGAFGLHNWFGFISERASKDRARLRKRNKEKCLKEKWLFKFQIQPDGESWKVQGLDSCQAKRIDESTWELNTGSGIFRFSEAAADVPEILTKRPPEEKGRQLILRISGILIFLIACTFLIVSRMGAIEEEKKAEIPKPVTVKITKPKPRQTVAVPTNLLKELPKAVAKDKKVHRAIAQQLGFLGLVGNQKITKALGGVPTKLKDASPGAGPGGKEGSGGELLVGLGKGVKRTTVGNTGVKGLGGVGTKGRGGGLGGYGNTLIASGEGKGIAAIPVSQDMVLDGGLDRSVIQATIAKYLSQVRACYEKGLDKNPGLAGQVAVAFVIGGNGFINSANVFRSSLGHSGVEGCIVTRMKTWKFPEPRGGVNVKVKYPFMLRPVSS